MARTRKFSELTKNWPAKRQKKVAKRVKETLHAMTLKAKRRICTDRWNGRSDTICRRWARWAHKFKGGRTWYLCDDHKCDNCRPMAVRKAGK